MLLHAESACRQRQASSSCDRRDAWIGRKGPGRSVVVERRLDHTVHTGGTAAHHRNARIINGVGTHRRRRWGSLGFPPLDLSSISCLAACLRRPIDPSRRPPVERIFPA
jgi:hypothetical protein